MSDDQNDKPTENESKGLFDLFEPPPEIDPNRFGPIPIVPDGDDGPPPDDAAVEADGADDDADVSPGEATISSIFGFDPIDPPDGAAVNAPEPVVVEPTPIGSLIDGVDDDVDPDDIRPPVEAVPIIDLDDAPPAETVVGDIADEIVGEAAPDGLEGDDIGAEAEGGDATLPHWTAPATGMVPKVIAGDDGDDGWAAVSGPRWHGEGPQWAGDDLESVFADEEGVGGPRRVTIEDDTDYPEIPGAAGSPQRPETAAARAAQRPVVEVDAGRNLAQAIGAGVAFAVVAGVAFWVGKATTVALITVVAVLAAIELFGAMRRAGLHPATLLGIVASGAMPLAVYHRGSAGFTLVMALAVLSAAMWYLSGADTQRPALNIGLTMLGITWIGGLAAFAAFILQSAGGVEVLLAAVLITVASDTGAYAGGRAIGNTPFHSASPNKTWEGTIVGVIAAVVVGLVVGILEISVFSGELTDAVLLGLVVGILAPIGDLTESMVKRDLGVKDMGTLLPGHGGFLDRVDGLLFVLPGVYYLGNVMGLL